MFVNKQITEAKARLCLQLCHFAEQRLLSSKSEILPTYANNGCGTTGHTKSSEAVAAKPLSDPYLVRVHLSFMC